MADRLLRIHSLQQWYTSSDPGVEEALYDSEAILRFAGIDLGCEGVPDESTMLQFRQLLERHGLTKQILAEVNRYLAGRGIYECQISFYHWPRWNVACGKADGGPIHERRFRSS